MQKRIGLKPLSNPATGTYWRAMRSYDQAGLKPGPVFVAVTGTERKYARLGMQTAFVNFVSAELFATNTHTKGHERHMDHTEFGNIFEQVTDEDTLSSELGLAILAMYD